ncbi:MAG: hypothetical protein A2086_02265 [Spirochaetes bacterium GWD1_27_9]|nr:MAG: hypothetical protein A2Z98_10085 [Spirochaetes bacterium GWB1_27_13]OHD22145.1 MAG: hypothetical protein A2Y34_14840 [Spirochaetes bacterium GWC1_27_15]OHD29262.1 MAG: hypothetical protein A2086_02265 [Spirochaetes bacterium GWD1_27_9]
MNKIVIIDDSYLMRNYLREIFERYNFEVILSSDGFDGITKIRNNLPDVIILDYQIKKRTSADLLTEMKLSKTTASIPVIMLASEVDMETILNLSKFNVAKLISKPLKIDILINTISDLLKKDIKIDTTPCFLDVHFNDDILFIEISEGLNVEKIEMLKYKIEELVVLYNIEVPKILIIISNISFTEKDAIKLDKFFSSIIKFSINPKKTVKVLSNSEFIQKFVFFNKKLKDIEVTDNINVAVDSLCNIEIRDIINKGLDAIKNELLVKSKELNEEKESLHLKFQSEKTEKNKSVFITEKKINIAVVDDDKVILQFMKKVLEDKNWIISTYENGKFFIDSLVNTVPDLVFLDMLMPKMTGFEVLESLKNLKLNIPVIVFSALSQQETVVKAREYGIKSYIVKPISPDIILKKANEALKLNF